MTLAELVHQLGDIPLERIHSKPPPGTATVADLIAACDGPEKRLCELIDGVLVEKVISALKSFLVATLSCSISNHLEERDLGIVLGPDGPFRILPGQVRLPDVSVVTWEKLPSRKVPRKKVLTIVPDLVVEVISEGNTRQEIQRKLREYFLAGVQEAWIIYPKTQSADIYTAPEKRKRIGPAQSLTSAVLPGFELPLARLFARVEKPKRKKKK